MFRINGTREEWTPEAHDALREGLLRLLGHSPENFDLFLYFAERQRQRAS